MKGRLRRRKRESGYTLLEYCAGAAVISGIIWVALQGLGDHLAGLLGSIGEWAASRASEIQP